MNIKGNNKSFWRELRSGIRFITRLTAVGIVLNCLVAQAATTYTLKDIGLTKPIAINNKGQVLGDLTQLYDSTTGTYTSLATMAGGATLSEGKDVNAAGQVVGNGFGIGLVAGFIRNLDGTLLHVGPSTDPNYAPGINWTINDLGQVAGNLASSLPCTSHVFLGSGTNPELIDIGTLGGRRAYAYDINNNADVVGISDIFIQGYNCSILPTYHAYVYTKLTGIRDLHSSTMGGNVSAAYKINTSGLVAGDFADGTTVPDFSGNYPNGYPVRHAIIWNAPANTYIDIGNVGLDSSLRAINDSGVAVGFERTLLNNSASVGPTIQNPRGVVYDPSVGNLVNLQTVVTNLPAGWVITNAMDINNAGQIIATATDTTVTGPFVSVHGILLTPSVTNSPLPQPPSAPNGLGATVVSQSQIDLKWVDTATNETSLVLERCQGNNTCTNFVAVANLVANTTTYSDVGLAASTQYSYRIKAHNANGDSSYSSVASATTLPPVSTPVPAAPSNLMTTTVSRRRIVLNWADNADNEQSFVIERCQGFGCTAFSAVVTVPANSVTYSNGGLSSNTSYRYRVKAINATGDSDYSNISSAKTFN